MSAPVRICPKCGKPLVMDGPRREIGESCSPLTSPDCWRFTPIGRDSDFLRDRPGGRATT